MKKTYPYSISCYEVNNIDENTGEELKEAKLSLFSVEFASTRELALQKAQRNLRDFSHIADVEVIINKRNEANEIVEVITGSALMQE